ncbi:helicase-like protein [Paraburkholderia silvatlantica]|uniref:Helicase-like protein n=1 Tax=Paraburkholderia silvatlantica TaxID=321895 RepID=A0A2V4U7I5_9BURK|nr:DEAD/DEAH box helicase [Paraburkholderia silvatlantica]PYE26362.1 helicase-like protein [Paraburkholderia silvatlantica]
MALIINKEPKLLPKREAFPYQAEAVEAVRDLPYAAVFHEQGLGKTKIAIDIILYWLQKDAVDTVLLVTKKTLVANWKRELEQHSFLTPRILSSDRNQNFFALNSPVRVLLTHFEAVGLELSRLKLFQKTRRVAAVLDESAKIKNPDTALTKAYFDLAPRFVQRLILTGTPVANRPHDLWAQIYFLDQGASLGSSFEDFQSTVELSNNLSRNELQRDRFEDELAGLWKKIAPFSVRETKDGGRIQLPQKIVESIRCGWEARQRKMYLNIRDETRVSVIQDGSQAVDESPAILKRLLRLVQVASNPRLIDESYNNLPGKWEILQDLVADIVASNEKAIVWTTFTENAEWLASKLANCNAAIIHGKLTIDQRNRNIERFLKRADCKILVATPGAAKEGLTLTVANHVIFFDRGFSLDDYLQSQDRIHRVSQTKTCYVYNLIMEDSVDEWVDALLEAKRAAAQLAQGDISKEVYQMRMSYSFGDVLKKILAIQENDKKGEKDD